MSTPESTRALLDDTAWLRSLARRLIQDGAAADDAVQETWLAAARKGLERPGRGWLAAVLGNAVRQSKRASGRRFDREQRHGAQGDEDGAGDVVARLEVQAQVVAAVRALDEPYRSTIALRFLDGLPPREVARRMNVPVKTVHTRVDRALALLRTRLDAHHGGARGTWALLLAPFAHPRLLAGSAGLGVFTMSATIKWTGLTAGLLLAGIYVARNFDAKPAVVGAVASEVPTAPTNLSPPSAPTAVASPPSAAPNDARRAVTGLASPAPEALAALERTTFEGRVVDTSLAPVAGVEVYFELTFGEPLDDPDALVTQSDAEGRFELPLVEQTGRLRARGPDLADLISPGLFGTLPPEPPLIVVAHTRAYAGVVVDERGDPVADAELAVTLGEELAEKFFVSPFGALAALRRTTSDASGQFTIEATAFAPGLRIRVSHPHHAAFEEELPASHARDLVLQLTPTEVHADTLSGFVLDPLHQPVEGAYVSLGGSVTQTDAHGAFSLSEDNAASTILRAVLAGHLPAQLDVSQVGASERDALELVLGDSPMSIAGRVVDAAGAPVAGAKVWTDGNKLGMHARYIGDLSFYVSVNVEDLMSGRPDGGSRSARADGRGAFELTSLLDRPYTIHALHPRTLELCRVETVPAGARSLSIVLPGSERRGPVGGRVIDSAGQPVEGAEVRAERALLDESGRPGSNTASVPGQAAFTDADGHFLFDELCLERTSLWLVGETSERRALAGEPDHEDVELRAVSVCHLRVTLEDPSSAEFFMVLDEHGEELLLTFHVGATGLGATSSQFKEGRSELIEVSESGRTLVLYGGAGTEVRRAPLQLKPGEVTELRL
jgi:RNA polymerase sigma-70 factor (ECF subfamily)